MIRTDMVEKLLADPFSAIHITQIDKKNWTNKSKTGSTLVCLDYFLIDNQLMKFVQSAMITGGENNFEQKNHSTQPRLQHLKIFPRHMEFHNSFLEEPANSYEEYQGQWSTSPRPK